jgi:lysophospholipase L1-like esterase
MSDAAGDDPGRGRSSWGRVVLGAGLAIGLVGLLISVVSGEATPRNSDTRAVVLFLGDSNITLAAANIDWALTWQDHEDNGYVPVMASRVGSAIRTPDCLEPEGCDTYDYWDGKLASIEDEVTPDAIVINLGVNDAESEGTATSPGYAAYDEKIDWLMERTGDVPVLWTNLPCALEPPDVQAGCEVVNDALEQAPERWPNLTLLDWSERAGTDTDLVLPRDVHLSPAGRALWTELVVEGLDTEFPAG